MYGELFIPPVFEGRNMKTGRYIKGHIPYNKGKKWSNLYTKKAQNRMKRGWGNLTKWLKENGRPKKSGSPPVQVIAVLDDGRWLFFPSMIEAANWIGGSRNGISHCCRKNRKGYINTNHQYKGVRFYYETENVWLSKIEER